jgi:hypothetical protein
MAVEMSVYPGFLVPAFFAQNNRIGTNIYFVAK